MKQLFIFLAIVIPVTGFSQDSTRIYRINKIVDYPIIVAGVAGTVYGAYLRAEKPGSDSMVIANLKRTRTNVIDEFAMNNASFEAGKVSDVLFIGGFLLPPLLLFHDKINDHTGTYLTLFLESMAITGGLYWMTAGLYNKYRPYSYNNDVPFHKRTSNAAKNSLYAGHVAVTATGTFFMAKVFDDYSDHKLATIGMYTLAGAATASCAYLRLRGGYHFSEDVLIGSVAGALSGILVPHLHKIKGAENVSVLPMMGNQKGCMVMMKF